MNTVTRRLLLGASAVILAGGAGGLVAGATVLPQASGPGSVDTATTVQVPAGNVTLVCPSAPQLADAGVDTDADFAQDGTQATSAQSIWSFPRGDVAAGVGTVTLLAADGAGESDQLTGVGTQGAATFTGSYQLAAATLEPTGEASALVAGGAVWEQREGDLRGLDAASCIQPSTDSWLVGGSTELGSTAVLELVNPGTTAATATISIFTELGQVDSAIPSELTIAAGEAVEFRVEAAAAEVSQLAVHVTSSGGAVAAFLHVSALDALTPMGVATVVPAASPTTTQLVPGVSIQESSDDAAADTQSVEPTGGSNIVRIVNPGEETATATVTLLGADGEVELPGAQSVAIDPGAVYDFSLAGIDPGDYTVQVEADEALAVGVQLDRAGAVDQELGAAPHDIAWLSAVATSTSGAVAVPVVAESNRLMLAALDDVVVTVTLWEEDGTSAQRQVQVTGGTTASVPVGAAVTLESTGPVAAAVLVESDDGSLVDAVPVGRDANVSHAVTMTVTN